MDEGNSNGWASWGKHVLKEQERQEGCIQDFQKLLTAIQVEIGMIKVKASLYGGLFGLFVGIIAGVIASFIYNTLAK